MKAAAPNPDLNFKPSDYPTLGVELELQLVDAESMALKNCVIDLLNDLPEEAHAWAKPELMQSYLEINSAVCRTVEEIGQDLREKITLLNTTAARKGARLHWAATHPFSMWMDQCVTPNERYHQLIETMQDTARRIVTFGMHIHVGVESGDKAVMLIDRLSRYLPTLLALSVNSPFWVGRDTGLHSQRSKIMEQLPAAGLPPFLRNYSEYCWLVNHSLQTGFLNSIREIWWDARPHPGFGTVEIRICDLPPNLDDVLALTALTQCLVQALSQRIDEGVYQHDIHPIMVKQNKWKALRYGRKAELIDPVTHKTVPVREMAFFLYEQLKPFAQTLACTRELNHLISMMDRPSGADEQRQLFKESKSLPEVVRRLVDAQPLTGLAALVGQTS